MSRTLRIAAAQYPIDRPGDWGSYAAKLSGWIDRGAALGADLLVFPEYAAMELASLFGPEVERDLARQLDALAGIEEEVAELTARFARARGVHVLGASMPARDGAEFRNRARLHGPDGLGAVQDKIVMTPFERDAWGVRGGGELRVVETRLGRIGVCICYDIEFPLLARALVEAGAEMILAPSCTEELSGMNRVHVGARARALENQCITVVAPTVGEAPWSPAVDRNRGAAAVFGPPDRGFPDDGIVAVGVLDAPGWVTAEVDLDRLAEVRARGGMRNHRDWPEQAGVPVGHDRIS